MAGRIGRIAMLLGTLLLALPAPGWADSSQAALAVSVVVPSRCAVRVPGLLGSTAMRAAGAGEAVAMRCTKGALPTAPGAPGGAAGPRISRDVVLPAAAPSPLAAAGTGEARVIITVNF